MIILAVYRTEILIESFYVPLDLVKPSHTMMHSYTVLYGYYTVKLLGVFSL